MSKNRMEAFSDGVLAIIITIMVLELKVPQGTDLSVLAPMLPVFGSYVLSFVYVGIYWNNHHHLLHSVQKVSGGILWANLHLLFWLSLLPFSGSSVQTEGQVRFSPRGDGTQLDVQLSYNPPAGAVGHAVAKLLGKDAKREIDEDLIRFKSLLETGKATGNQTVTREQIAEHVHRPPAGA